MQCFSLSYLANVLFFNIYTMLVYFSVSQLRESSCFCPKINVSHLLLQHFIPTANIYIYSLIPS